MKAIILFLICIQSVFCFAQPNMPLVIGDWGIGVAKESKTTANFIHRMMPFYAEIGAHSWHTIDIIECGINTCTHDLVHSKLYPTHDPRISCTASLRSHRCSWTENYRKSICRKCRFHILESDYDPTPPVPAIEPEDEYEKLIKKQ